jgi:hypothetical protein
MWLGWSESVSMRFSQSPRSHDSSIADGSSYNTLEDLLITYLKFPRSTNATPALAATRPGSKIIELSELILHPFELIQSI